MKLAVSLGAHALGLVSEMPSGPGVIAEDDIARLAALAPPGVSCFLLTSRTDGHAIAEQSRRTGTWTVQLCDKPERGAVATLRRERPGVKVVAVVHVTGPGSVEEARGLAGDVDAILLDSGNPALAVKELGGTGRVHDWAISEEIVRTVAVPVYLAGGLQAGNVAEAVRKVRPFGVDVCSGVRREGRLDAARLSDFTRALSSGGA